MRRITAEMSQWRLDTQNGASLIFERCKGGYFSALDEYGLMVSGKTAQHSTPTPDNPVPIQCVKTGTMIYAANVNGEAVSQVITPCDLYEGDVWYLMTGRVERHNIIKTLGTDDWTWNSYSFPNNPNAYVYYLSRHGNILKRILLRRLLL